MRQSFNKKNNFSRPVKNPTRSFSKDSEGNSKGATKSDYKPNSEKKETFSKNDRPFRKSFAENSINERPIGVKFQSKDKSKSPAKRNFEKDKQSRDNSFSSTEKKWEPKKPFKKNFDRDKDRRAEDRPIKKFENKGSRYSPENFSVGKNAEKDFYTRPRRARVSESKDANTDNNDLSFGTVRLNKYIANAGICSRREADVLIQTGAITVNGKIVSELGYKVSATDIVAYGGQGIRREKNVYILLNKPKDYITTADDPMERKTVMHLIKGACKERVYPVGRLDRNSTGLLILTNDGELTKKLTHPRYEKKKIYHIELDRPLTKEDMQKILEGVELEDGMVHVDEISYVVGAASKKEVGIELHSGKNRVIRRIFEHLGYEVKKLDRVYFAGLSKKDLPRGKWRFLSEREVAMLNSK